MGAPITLWADPVRTAAALQAVSQHDADVVAGGLRLGWRYRRLETRHAREFTRVLPQSVADWLQDHLESEALRALLATRGMRSNAMSPLMAGTAAALLTDAAGNSGGASGETVYARGGPGALVAALASAAHEAGVIIRIDAEVTSVRDRDGQVSGLVLADGEEIEAPVVASGLDPRTTLAGLVDPETLGPDLGWETANLRDRGVTAKANLALSGLPAFTDLAGPENAERLRGRLVLALSVAYLDRAADDAKYGRVSEAPWLEATIPSLVDPLLVDGAAAIGVRHVMSVIAQPAPVDLREGDWDGQRRTGRPGRDDAAARGPGHRRPRRGA